MPKDSRARVNAVRAVMAETGLPYNRAANLLDSRAGRRVAEPALAAASVLRVMPFVLAAAVPAVADPGEIAQGLADQLHTLHRSSTGETYAGRADVFVPANPWEPEAGRPGHVAAIFLVHAWAARPWDTGDEWEHVVTDFFAVAGDWLMSRDPAGGRPAVLPIGWMAAKAMAERARVTAHTGGEHEGLPEGWAELIAARQAEMSPADGEPRMPESAVQRLVLPGLVPNSPGGAGKTTLVWDRDGQSDLTTWVDQVSAPAGSEPSLPGGAVEPRGGGARTGAEDPARPYRVVDRHFQGWYRRSGDGLYDADGGHRRGLETMSYEDLAAGRGPLRPVEPPTPEESAAVTAALAGAGRRAAASLLVALFRLSERDAIARRTSGAKNWMTAGREGSHEAASLDRLAWSIGADLDEKPKRYDAAAVDELMRVIEGWVCGPDRYVEVAATLASEFSAVADAAGGWAAVADRYMQRHQRVGHPDEVVEAVQRYLMSQSTAHTFE